MFDAGTSQQLMTRTQGLRLFVGKCANRTSLEVRKRYGSLIKVRRITCGCVSRIPLTSTAFLFLRKLAGIKSLPRTFAGNTRKEWAALRGFGEGILWRAPNPHTFFHFYRPFNG